MVFFICQESLASVFKRFLSVESLSSNEMFYRCLLSSCVFFFFLFRLCVLFSVFMKNTPNSSIALPASHIWTAHLQRTKWLTGKKRLLVGLKKKKITFYFTKSVTEICVISQDRYFHIKNIFIKKQKKQRKVQFCEDSLSEEECDSTIPGTPAHQIQLYWEEFCASWIRMGHCHSDNKESILSSGRDLSGSFRIKKLFTGIKSLRKATGLKS